MRGIEFTGSGSPDTADDLDEFSILCKVHDAGIAVTVGYENVAVACNRDIGGTIEGRRGAVVAGYTLRSQRQKLLTVHRELVNHMVGRVRDPDIAFMVDIHAMDVGEEIGAPAVEEVSFTVENQNGRLCAPKHDDGSAAIGSDRYRIAPLAAPRVAYRKARLCNHCSW